MNQSVRKRECKKGFWFPDDISRVLMVEGPKAVMFYTFLGQYQSLQDYPPASHLASLMQMETGEIWELIERLHELGALNDHDVKAIFNKSEEEHLSP